MEDSFREKVSTSRLLMGNPYAYLDDSGNYSALPSEPSNRSQLIRDSRLTFQNQYAHLNPDGVYDGLPNLPKITIPSSSHERYTFGDLEQKAQFLQTELWKNKERIWPEGVPEKLSSIFDPTIALRVLGYDCELSESLGQFYQYGRTIEVAGSIDRVQKKVKISRKFQENVRRFTAAHELGHALLHQTNGLHRDRAIDGSKISRDRLENDADKFAAFFLIPEIHLRKAFRKLFLTENFSLNEETAFALGYKDYQTAYSACRTPRELSRKLASTNLFNARHFISLADQFLVSIETMAIRIEEVGLIRQ